MKSKDTLKSPNYALRRATAIGAAVLASTGIYFSVKGVESKITNVNMVQQLERPSGQVLDSIYRGKTNIDLSKVMVVHDGSHASTAWGEAEAIVENQKDPRELSEIISAQNEGGPGDAIVPIADVTHATSAQSIAHAKHGFEMMTVGGPNITSNK